MKPKFLLIAMFILSVLIFSSCNSDSPPTTTDEPLTVSEISSAQMMDNTLDDVLAIADDQYELNEGSAFGRYSETYHSFIPSCATVSDLGSTTDLKVITITFGTETTTCKFRGHYLKGQIILTRTIGTIFPKIMTVTFNNFYVNNNKLEGSATWKREMIGNDLHPKTTFIMTDITLTTLKGVYTRNGERIREMIEGYSTRLTFTDNVFSTYGNFTTTYPNGDVFTSLINIETPLIYKAACGFEEKSFPVSGILNLSKNSHFATIDYGNGDCDSLVMLSIDGGLPYQITLDDDNHHD
ncbi:MAG TPA: hypothetical protein VIV55_05425 [Flavobacterium sp.]